MTLPNSDLSYQVNIHDDRAFVYGKMTLQNARLILDLLELQGFTHIKGEDYPVLHGIKQESAPYGAPHDV